jgi:hypothetical protein
VGVVVVFADIDVAVCAAAGTAVAVAGFCLFFAVGGWTASTGCVTPAGPACLAGLPGLLDAIATPAIAVVVSTAAVAHAVPLVRQRRRSDVFCQARRLGPSTRSMPRRGMPAKPFMQGPLPWRVGMPYPAAITQFAAETYAWPLEAHKMPLAK